jgi:hypothetical protein
VRGLSSSPPKSFNCYDITIYTTKIKREGEDKMAKKRVEEGVKEQTAMEGLFEQQQDNANFAGMSLDVNPQDMPPMHINANPVVEQSEEKLQPKEKETKDFC